MFMKSARLGRALAAVIIISGAFAPPAFAQGATASSPPGQAGPSLALTMDEAIKMALEFNLGLEAERLNLDQASHQVALARATFLPFVSATVNRQNAKFLPTDFTQGASDLSSEGLNLSGSISQNLRWFGSRYQVQLAGNRNEQIGGLSSFNPRLGSSLRVDYAQPLLRGFKTDSARTSLETTARRRAITDVQLEQRIVSMEASVRLAYLTLVGAIEGLKVAEQNMDIVQQSLVQSRARVAVGQSPQIEIIQAEAQVAANREQLILAAASISTAEDSLRSLIMDPQRPDYWSVKIVPTDQITLVPREINVDQVMRNALANRLDLSVVKRELEILDVNLRLTKENLLPSVDFNLTYAASGTAGTQFTFGSGFPPPVIDQTTRGLGSALSDTFGGAYPSWSVGVTVGYPLGRNGDKIAHAQTQVTKRQQELGLRELELEIVRQVRDAIRQVENSWERVQAAQAFRQAAQQQLDAEDRRFEVGISTNLERQVRQRELAQARTQELSAIISYARALIILDRVQRTQ